MDKPTEPGISWTRLWSLDGGRKFSHDGQAHKWLYHYLPWPYAMAIIEQDRLRLQPVQSWRDPYEKSWCEALFNQDSSLAGVNAYGLCWTTSYFDEPMWRMAAFERSGPIVRVKCKPTALVQVGRKLIATLAGSLYLGTVKYRREKHLDSLANSVTARETSEKSSVAAAMLLQKRSAFRFEREVRLLWLDRQPKVQCIYLNIDPMTLISEVMISPYATDEQNSEMREYLRRRNINVVESLLMQPPRWKTRSSVALSPSVRPS